MGVRIAVFLSLISLALALAAIYLITLDIPERMIHSQEGDMLFMTRIGAVVRRLGALEGKEQDGALVELEKRMAAVEEKARPARIRSGVFAAGKGEVSWKLTDLLAKERTFTTRIAFSSPFEQAPKVVLGLSRLALPEEGGEVSIRAEKIDKAGFTIVFVAKEGAKPRNLEAQWLAYVP